MENDEIKPVPYQIVPIIALETAMVMFRGEDNGRSYSEIAREIIGHYWKAYDAVPQVHAKPTPLADINAHQ